MPEKSGKKPVIAVIDGQGGGIGRTLVEKLRSSYGSSMLIRAIGTNSAATAAMLKAGADEGATGENAVVFNAPKADIIIGVIGIIAANSMLGELSPAMASAIAGCCAQKVLIPVGKCGINIAGVKDDQLQSHIDSAIGMVGAIAGDRGWISTIKA